ncbi:hypothetical protein FQN53_003621 [Emmonsiellopsis sp. PD_33]|nr:hypothetical protein FQN53_003621 [Emmonsiellopsis sp. PD_33]
MSRTEKKILSHRAYTVALICPLAIEFSAARYMLDEEHERLPRKEGDTNHYILGVMSRHNTVLASLPKGSQGTTPAATVAINLARSFPNIRLRLLVGIGGGIPSNDNDIRLGDVVVSAPTGISGGVVEYDLGKQTTTGFERKGILCPPPSEWGTMVTAMETNHEANQNKITEFLSEMLRKYPRLTGYERPLDPKSDILFRAEYKHVVKGATCAYCNNKDAVITRFQRKEPDQPKIFYGLIASGNSVIKDGEKRDRLARDAGGAICFEMEAAGLMNEFRCIVIRGIADYCDSHKNDEWHRYAAAAAAGLAKEILLLEAPAPCAKEDEELREKKIGILIKLKTCDYQEAKDRNRRRVEGTCEWFTGHPRFRQWLETEGSALLWVSADPGCGKSVLARYLIDELLLTSELRTVCYFFFKDDFEDQKSLPSALCCILHQLFERKPELLSREVVEVLEKDDQYLLKSARGLWRILIDAISQGGAGEIVCVLDALDECGGEGQKQLADSLCNLYDGRAGRCRLKFLLTSRPYYSIQRNFQLLENVFPTIHLHGENENEVQQISAEIDIVVRHEVKRIFKRRELVQEEQDLVLKELSSIPNRTYLWVYLVLHALDEIVSITLINICALVKQLPRSVNEAYDGILCKSRYPEEAKKALHIIVAATRPLLLEEMAIAMAVVKGDQLVAAHEIEVEREDRFRNSIREICGLFVTIVDSKIYLLHQSAREFLIYKHAEALHPSLKWKGSLRPTDSDLTLATACTYYFMYMLPRISASKPSNVSDILKCRDLYPFSRYSAQNWSLHVRRACIEGDAALFPSVVELIDPRRDDIRRVFGEIMKYEHNRDIDSFIARHIDIASFSPLLRASFFGFAGVAEQLLRDKKIDVNQRDRVGRSALCWAAINGHEEIVKLLVSARPQSSSTYWPFKQRIKVDMLDHHKISPLSHAARRGHVNVVKILLETLKVNPNARNSYGWTPLHWAAICGHEGVVKLLLDIREVNPACQNHIGWTPLHFAAKGGYEGIMKILLDTGKVDPACQDHDGRTLLHFAARHGHEGVIKLLLDTGEVNPACQDHDGWTSLHWAAKCGHEGVVKLLLDIRKVDPACQDHDGWTSLHWAAKCGHAEVVKLLLDTGKADPTCQNRPGRTALGIAAIFGHEGVVKLLLDNCKPDDINIKDKSGETPLDIAVSRGYTHIAEMLRKAGGISGGMKP